MVLQNMKKGLSSGNVLECEGSMGEEGTGFVLTSVGMDGDAGLSTCEVLRGLNDLLHRLVWSDWADLGGTSFSVTA